MEWIQTSSVKAIDLVTIKDSKHLIDINLPWDFTPLRSQRTPVSAAGASL